MRNAGPHAFGSGTKCTAVKNIGVGKAWPFLTYQGDGAIFGKPIEFFVQRRNLSLELARSFVALREIKIADRVKFVSGPGRDRFLDDLRDIVFDRKARGFFF